MRKRRTDDNHSSLIDQIRQIPGASVFSTHTLGRGFVDAVLGYGQRNYLLEIKDPNKPPSKKALTPDEIKFHQTWQGSVHVVETIEDVLKILTNKIN